MQKKPHKPSTTIITSGMLRGETILTPGGDTHPMGSREKIALFNMIQDNLPGAFVLDAYAGSGALGIEAISRGAAFTLFVDKDQKAVHIINQNLAKLGLYGHQGGALRKDILKEADTATDRFSIVLADPPYEDYREEMVTSLAPLVAPGGILVTSTPAEPPEVPGFNLLKNRKYARCHISIYQSRLN